LWWTKVPWAPIAAIAARDTLRRFGLPLVLILILVVAALLYFR
jgi:hypothetical protein